MARIKHVGTVNEREKDFLKLFDQLTYSRSAWQVWEDLMTVMACSICNAVDRRKEPFERREKQYERAIKDLGGVDIPAQMFGMITMALEENPNQDFLGRLYMNLNLGSHWHGQFFTPYHVCELMARMQIGEGCRAEIDEKGYISVCDPCVGAGAILIAAATAFRECKVDYHTSALFIGQDVDPVVAKMAYIQISLLGCPGYITVGNSLTNPQTGHVLFPEENEGQELWITPLFMHQVWEMRRTGVLMRNLFSGIETTVKTMEKEHFFVFFQSQGGNEMEEMKLQQETEFGSSDISEKNREALQSGTWQKAREAIKAIKANVSDSKEDEAEKPVEDATEKGNKAKKTEDNEDMKSSVKVYPHGKDKLLDEENKMLESVKTEHKAVMQAQLDLIFKELIEQADKDPEFERKVLLQHKSMERCMKFCSEKAMGLRNPSDAEKTAARNGTAPIMTPVGSDMLFGWIREYYDKDDKAEVEKEEKKKADEKKRKEEAKKKASARDADAAKKKKEQEAKRKAEAEKKAEAAKKKEEAKKAASKKKEMDNQLSIFDMMGV